MNSAVDFIYSYMAGTKTIEGIFPIYSSSLLECQTDVFVTPIDTRELTKELPPDVLWTAESNNIDYNSLVVLLSDVDPDLEFEIYI